ncbi:MAG TPA: 4'-phosphopantetheinyl transferase superfamily protein [Alcaligenes sp.]|nr:4'-phosphopantetheinyl transferase superfamily protein [Alcaligenes sp.]HRL26148.1 4'-phosphopantetheinyl transferase superfamily protein [Alcaligenes sp.]
MSPRLFMLPVPLPTSLLPWMQAQVPDSTLVRIARLRRTADQHLSLLAHAALRHLLAPLLGCAARDIPMRSLPHGKPVLDMARPELHFSLSHSGQRVLLGIAGQPLGVDIEATHVPVDAALPAQCSLPAELHWLHSDLDFYALWCAKEAALKQAGTGFSIGPKELMLDGHPSLGCSIQSPHSVLNGLHVCSRTPEPGYAAALCLQQTLPVWCIERLEPEQLPDSRLGSNA